MALKLLHPHDDPGVQGASLDEGTDYSGTVRQGRDWQLMLANGSFLRPVQPGNEKAVHSEIQQVRTFTCTGWMRLSGTLDPRY